MSELVVNLTEDVLEVEITEQLTATLTEDVLSAEVTTDGLVVTITDDVLSVTFEGDLTATISEDVTAVSLGDVVEITNNYTSGGKLTVEFDYTDFGATKTIGEIISGKVIINTVVEIDTAFDTGTFTIGKDSAQAILMAIADRGNAVNRYLVNNYIELTTTDTYKLFFSGSPTQGSGKVFITYV